MAEIRVLPKRFNLLLDKNFYDLHQAVDKDNILILGDGSQFYVNDRRALTDDQGEVTDYRVAGYLMSENIVYQASNIEQINKKWNHSADGTLSIVISIDKKDYPYATGAFIEGHTLMLDDNSLYTIGAVLDNTPDTFSFIGTLF